jgi:hypothetical protein
VEILLDIARDLGENPNYAFLNTYGPDGLLNPAFWGGVELGHWLDAKAPVAQPNYGFRMEVKSIDERAISRARLQLEWVQ